MKFKSSEKYHFGFFAFMFYIIAISFLILSTAIPLFTNAFNLSVIIGSVFLIGGVLVSLLWEIKKTLNKIPGFESSTV